MKITSILSSILMASVMTAGVGFTQDVNVPTTASPVRESQEALYDSAMTAFQAVRNGDTSKLEELGRMLEDPRLNTVARTALENLPERAGLETLRRGLGAVDNRCVAGVVDSLGNLRDTESVTRLIEFASCDCHAEIIRLAALRSLGKIGGKEAYAVLLSCLNDAHLNVQRAAADGLFTLAENLVKTETEMDSETAVNTAISAYQAVREAKIDGATTRIATQNEILITGDTALFQALLTAENVETPENADDFRSAQIVLAQTDKMELFRVALDSIMHGKMPAEWQVRTLAVLGASGNKELTPILLEMLEKQELNAQRVAILDALGRLKDAETLKTLTKYLADSDENVRRTAIEGICRLDAETVGKAGVIFTENNAETSENVGNTENCSKKTLAEIEIVERLGMTQFLPTLKMLMTEKKAENDAENGDEIASVAMMAYSRIVTPGIGDVAEFATVFAEQNLVPEAVFEVAMSNLLRRSVDKVGTLDFLTKTYGEEPVRLVRYAAMIGGKGAAEFLGSSALRYAKMTDDAQAQEAVDVATEALGKWTTADAGQILARLACALPTEKYRTRCMRGYFRILRQMGMTPLEKRQMLNTSLFFIEGKPEERERFAEMVDRFQRQFPEKALFNGKDLTGWEMVADVFRVEDGVIVGGNFETGLDRNQFLTTTESYGDFYLRLDCKIIEGPTNMRKDGNAGVQIRSVRIPNNHEMVGYQADMTTDGSYWGCLYDESRRNRMLQTPDAEMKALLAEGIWKRNDWNRYEILCQGRNIRIYVNGVETVNYTETDETIPQTGLIGLQIHAGGPAQSYYRNIFISTATASDSRW
ncbi:MAG: DUF1080 domain-containing protein [Planctomycetia bacterium]|nr:DUF1080 domain-containing protein [Planctomycetia bacterium]